MRRHNSNRHSGHDYAADAAYLLTIVTHEREELFGQIADGTMDLNEFGLIARDEWSRTRELREEIVLDVFQIMPNHLHAIVMFARNADHRGAHSRAPLRDDIPRKARSLGSLVAGYKSAVTAQINMLRKIPGARVWQRNYHERIIRNAGGLRAARQYILDNPRHWLEDDENPIVRSRSQR